MHFDIDDDDRLIIDSVSQFAADLLRPNIRAAEAARQPTAEARAAFSDMGLEFLALSQAAGGVGASMLTQTRVARELAKADPGAALALDRIGPGAQALQAFDSSALGEFVRPVLASGDRRLVLLVEEADRGLRAGDRVTGSVPWFPANRADVVVGLGPSSAWVLDGPASVAWVPGAGLLAAGSSRIDFDGTVAKSWSDTEAAGRALAEVRLYYAALILGVLYDATEFSRAYAQERSVFGRPVAHHQGMAFLIVDLFAAVERARLLIEDAARRIDDGSDARQHAAAAFVEVVEASRQVGPDGVQILGGHGFMRDYPVEKAMRESRGLGLLAGGVERARDDASALAVAFEDTFVGA